MKIMILIPSLSSGGAERVTVNLANYWVNSGHAVTVTTLDTGSHSFYPLDPAVKLVGINLASESKSKFFAAWVNIRRLYAVRQVLRSEVPDVALGMMPAANVLLAINSWRLKGTFFVGAERVHPPTVNIGRQWEWLRRATYRFLDVVVAQTHESARWIRANLKVRKVEIVPNPVVWPLPTQEPTIEPKLFIKPDRKILIAVGRMTDQKQFKLLIECFARLSDKNPQWDLVILGEGPDRQQLLSLTENLNVSGRVKLPGRVGNLADWYQSADLFVLSSKFEGFPNVLVEAMSYGLASISFDCDTGPRDILRNEVDGLLLPLNDREALIGAIARLMIREDQRTEFAARAKEVRQRFAIQKIAEKWLQVFTSGRAGSISS